MAMDAASKNLDELADVLEANPQSWFVGIGSGDPRNAFVYFAHRGVAGRVRFLPQQREPEVVLQEERHLIHV